ncbi:DUF1007 family protein [Campylobacter sputorum]|uniref:HoxN/HupN/NixA family nickel/cobalt transporter n=1 Tax=Campylobacter sputorum TaxID=206 RepID=UPI00053BF372|nr:DUF1007 family protein [Campylobacter sputorum]
MIKKFFYTLLLLNVFNISAFGCALCALYTPTAHIEVKFKTKKDIIENLELTWTFSENFSDLTKYDYDINSDLKLDKKELKEIENALIKYLKPLNYLTHLSFYDEGQKSSELKFKEVSHKVYYEGNRLKFNLILNINLDIKFSRVLVLNIHDKMGYFNFKISHLDSFELYDNVFLVDNVNLNTVYYEMTSQKKAIIHAQKPTLNSLLDKSANKYHEIDKIDMQKISELNKISISFLDDLKDLLKQNKEHFSIFTMSAILLFSFIYGFFHAAGPGHGKMLTSAYFTANGGSHIKALNFSLKVGFLHVVGAFLLVFLMFFILSKFSMIYTKNISSITTKISAIMIICIAVYMLYKKLKSLKKQKPKFKWHQKGCGCMACKSLQMQPKTYSEWLVAACAALVPCPGTVLVFILAFELGSYFVAIASAVFMALGMSSVIFISAIFGSGVNAFAKFKNLKIYAELLAIFIMLFFGVFMLYISNKISVL